MSAARCYNCGVTGHIARACPNQVDVSSRVSLPPPRVELSYPTDTMLEGGGRVTEVWGDLMTSSDSLCHCVSECLAMGKGIAVLFKDRFGRVDELKAQRAGVGSVAWLDISESQPRFVYYLITKPRYFHKPTYQTLAASLAAMFQHMNDRGVTSLSMPEIGCGLDGLSWDKVRDMLHVMLRGSGIHVTVYHFKK